MSREHRTHIYTVLVLHKFARLIRWDHSGAVVTEKFNYKAHPEILGEFFWRFAHMTDEAQGYDPTAQLVSPGTTLYRLMDQMAAEKLSQSFDYIRVAFQKSLDARWLRYKLAVEDKERGTRYFLVGKPQHISSGLVGHGTRSYVAIDVEKEEFVHLKDHWRLDYDVMDEEEKQDEKDGHPLRTGGPHLEVHYRLVEKEVGQPLSEFETSLELVKLISDCIIAHEDAVKFARVFHRDVSPGNMIMYPVEETDHEGVTEHIWTGLLNGWELSEAIAKPGLADAARRANRIGAWQFRSSAILDDKRRRPMIEDELESFFYVLVYYGVRYLKHNSEDVASFMLAFFERCSFSNGEYSCGLDKRLAIHSGKLKWTDNRKIVFKGEGSRRHPLNHLIATMLPWFQGRYHMMERERELLEESTSGTDTQAETQTNNYAAFVTDKDIDDEDDDSTENEAGSNGGEIKFVKAASRLNSHRAMRLLLRKAVKTANWPSDDKLGDQLPKEYTSKRTRRSKDSDATTIAEKRRPKDILADIYTRKRPRHA
ncbi:hypothetical protein A0H81_06312 [Grifola frondosa]|uniref:Fungal-type protein kinase domain-containing protein n=1 Tax=Grifola frondosa TaxID=5627 RepID=A0A1C7MAQ3_GRIFR|nr:hypothetical protein A0H81_06312 [Grifola frondosa]